MFGWFKKKKKKAHPNASESRNSDSGSMYDPLSPTYVSTVAVAESYDEEIVEDRNTEDAADSNSDTDSGSDSSDSCGDSGGSD